MGIVGQTAVDVEYDYFLLFSHRTKRKVKNADVMNVAMISEFMGLSVRIFLLEVLRLQHGFVVVLPNREDRGPQKRREFGNVPMFFRHGRKIRK